MGENMGKTADQTHKGFERQKVNKKAFFELLKTVKYFFELLKKETHFKNYSKKVNSLF